MNTGRAVWCLTILCLLTTSVGGCTGPRRPAAKTASVQGERSVPILEREKLFGGVTRTNPRLSPDGRWLSWIEPVSGVPNLWLSPREAPEAARALTQVTRPVAEYQWASDSSQLLFMADNDGDENFQLHSVDVSTGRTRSLTPPGNVQARLVATSPHLPDRVLVGLNSRDRRWHDIYSLDLSTGASSLLFENRGYSFFVVDRALRLRVVGEARSDGGHDYFRVRDNLPEPQPFARIDLEDTRATEPISISEDGLTLHWLDSRGRNTAALVAQNLVSGSRSVLGSDERADVEHVLAHPATGAIDAYAVDYLAREWRGLSSRTADDLAFLQGRLEGQIEIASRSAADDLWLVNVDAVSAPVVSFLFERETRRITRLFSRRPSLEGAVLATMHAVAIPARDNLLLPSFYTLPPQTDPDGDGRPSAPVPLVLFVHGGPWSRDSLGYNGTHQWLANRGYAVLSVNFRGSTGFGKSFTTAGDGEWGRRMQHDLTDAVEWAISQGIAHRDRVAIFGGSYGGYATLVGMTSTPEAYACGIDVFGPSNLISLLQGLPADWGWRRMQFYNRVGDPNTAEGRAILAERSPVFSAHRIRRPLLIVQNANDPRVPRNESDQMVSRMRALNLPVTYLIFPNEGHGLARPENNVAFSAVTEQFLARCLGGRAEPIGEALRRSSAQVPVGAELIPGLAAAVSGRAGAAQ